MKASTRTIYGDAKVLDIREVGRPNLKEDEVLVRIHAATVNRTDVALLRGYPLIMRFFSGLRKPRLSITGTDFAGEIIEAGKHVTRFSVGERVWGFHDQGLQSHATYMRIPEKGNIESIPDGVEFSIAVASAEAAHYAINILNKITLEKGQQAMVHGATGAIGSACVQLLRANGLEVSATCRGEHAQIVHGLGADHTIDYTQEDFTRAPGSYDLVIDSVGKSTFNACKRILHKDGTYISSELGPGAQNLFFALSTPVLGGKKVIFPFPSNIKSSLSKMNALLTKGIFNPLIDRTYPLSEISSAFTYVASGQKIGNVLIADFS
ncbi:MAG: NAD(P)-dependent alcohol dehydrogenase [Saprospiraceae bacterium]|nr:NAD(P)-dependent alcohol dehydrogenase [Saprospiraceae bacterium]